MSRVNLPNSDEDVNSNWKWLYRSGGAASLLMVVIILIQFVIFLIWPQPLGGEILDWFRIFQESSLIGLISFELLMVIYVILSVLVALALCIALGRFNQSLTIIYLVISLIGIMSFIAARPAFEMLSLSNQYTAAATDAQRSVFLAAGEGMLATFHGTAFYVSYILGSLGGFIVSAVMLQSKIFSKTTAYMRIASSIFDFGLFVPGIGLYLSIFSVLFLFIWNILIALRLFQLGSSVKKI